ncbi:MAG: class I SAM-dependent methyltransferase [Pseudanabaena sp. SU_2_4]|nr:class I SAM-dependent methyltransferase [Pseudanabaena sp. SU_2_4]
MEEDTQKRTDRDPQTSALPKEAIAVCTRYFDEVLARQVLLGCKQIVYLGPSLSDRIMEKHRVEKHTEEVTYFKIVRTRQDAILQFIPEHPDGNRNIAKAKFIPGDYVKDDIISLLSANGFDFDMPTWFLWEVEVLHLRRWGGYFYIRKNSR